MFTQDTILSVQMTPWHQARSITAPNLRFCDGAKANSNDEVEKEEVRIFFSFYFHKESFGVKRDDGLS